MDIKELFLYKLFQMYVFNVLGVADTAEWLVMLQLILGFFLPMMTLYKLLNRRSTVERWVCCMIPSVMIMSAAILETVVFGYFCSDAYSLYDQLRWFLHSGNFFKESLVLCGLFFVCSVLFTILSRKVTNASVFHLVLNQIVEYLIVALVLWFSYDYLIKGGRALFKIDDKLIRWYVYGLWTLIRQSVFYLLCIVCFLLFYERSPKFVDGSYVSSDEWLAHYLSDNYRGPGTSVLLYGLLFCWMSVMCFKDSRNQGEYLMSYVIAALAAVIIIAGLFMIFFAVFPKLLGSYKMIFKGSNADKMTEQIYRELEQERPLQEFGFGRGFVTRNFIVLYLPLRIYYIPFCYKRYGNWFYFSDGRRFFVHECDARIVRSYMR